MTNKQSRLSWLSNIRLHYTNRLTKLWYGLVDQVFSVGAVFLANILLARSSSEIEYGAFTLGYSIYVLGGSIHNALVLEPYTVFASGKYRNQFADYLQLILRVSLTVGVLLALLSFLITCGVMLFSPNLFRPVMYGVVVGILLLMTGQLYRRVYYVVLDSAAAARISVLYFFVICFGLVGLLTTGNLSALTVFLILSVGWVVVSPIFFWRYRILPGAMRFLSDHSGYWQDHWRYSRWVLATALIFQFTNQGYYWIIGLLLTVEDVARLRAIQNVVLPINVFFVAVSLLILPRMSMTFQKQSTKGLNPLVWKMIFLVLSTAGAYFAITLLFCEEIIDLIYSGKYNSYAHLLYIMGLTPMALGVGDIFNNALKAMEEPKWVFYAYVAGGGITFTFGVFMVINYGLAGAAWGTVVSMVAYMLLLSYGFFRVSRRVALSNLKPIILKGER